MKKLLVTLTLVAFATFLVGLAAPALADPDLGYHEVLEWDGTGWVATDKASLYSQGSDSDQYRYENEVQPCWWPYVDPYPQPPVQFHIRNDAHLFPWIEADITEIHLTWDIFKPGDYMAKTFIVQLQANTAVQVHLGGGSWYIPGPLVDGKLNGHIDLVLFTEKEDDEDALIEDKERERGLLRDLELNYKNPGTPDDFIDVRWAWYFTYGDKPDLHYIDDSELAQLPADKDDWTRASDLNCTVIIVEDSDELHEPENFHIVFFEDVEVEPCDSEGKYVDLFAITITPDP